MAFPGWVPVDEAQEIRTDPASFDLRFDFAGCRHNYGVGTGLEHPEPIFEGRD